MRVAIPVEGVKLEHGLRRRRRCNELINNGNKFNMGNQINKLQFGSSPPGGAPPSRLPSPEPERPAMAAAWAKMMDISIKI
jgi:hypothetical protein